MMTLINKVKRAQFLNCLNVPLLHALQLHSLKHFAVFWAYLFHRKLHVNPAVFNYIVNKICELEIFNSGLNHLQLPVSIQLVIFFNHMGHYKNAIFLEDVSQWAGCQHSVIIIFLTSVFFLLFVVHCPYFSSFLFIVRWTIPYLLLTLFQLLYSLPFNYNLFLSHSPGLSPPLAISLMVVTCSLPFSMFYIFLIR